MGKRNKRRERIEERQRDFDAMCERLQKTAFGAELVRKRGVTRPGSWKK